MPARSVAGLPVRVYPKWGKMGRVTLGCTAWGALRAAYLSPLTDGLSA
jgi:hypothetical protein